jgi:hypothetical protein
VTKAPQVAISEIIAEQHDNIGFGGFGRDGSPENQSEGSEEHGENSGDTC